MYRKKPVVIEARQFDGSWESAGAIVAWIVSQGGKAHREWTGQGGQVGLFIETLEGDHQASTLDQVIKGVAGEFYPCKPDIFTSTYDPVDV
jgi:hypothetical protein